MHTRLELQRKLEELFNSTNVYYQPPTGNLMEYPAIRYSKSDISNLKADNKKYVNFNCYDVIVIDKKPDNPVINKLLDMEYSEFDRHYVYNNLNHDVIKIYF